MAPLRCAGLLEGAGDALVGCVHPPTEIVDGRLLCAAHALQARHDIMQEGLIDVLRYAEGAGQLRIAGMAGEALVLAGHMARGDGEPAEIVVRGVAPAGTPLIVAPPLGQEITDGAHQGVKHLVDFYNSVPGGERQIDTGETGKAPYNGLSSTLWRSILQADTVPSSAAAADQSFVRVEPGFEFRGVRVDHGGRETDATVDEDASLNVEAVRSTADALAQVGIARDEPRSSQISEVCEDVGDSTDDGVITPPDQIKPPPPPPAAPAASPAPATDPSPAPEPPASPAMRAEPALQAPAPGSKPTAPDALAPVGRWSPERNALLKKLWPTDVLTKDIKTQLEELPGTPIPFDRIAIQASYLGVKRATPGISPRPQASAVSAKPSAPPAVPVVPTKQVLSASASDVPLIEAASFTGLADTPVTRPAPPRPNAPAPASQPLPEPYVPRRSSPEMLVKSEGAPADGLTAGQMGDGCSWIVNDTKPYRFCGKPRNGRKQYCVKHCDEARHKSAADIRRAPIAQQVAGR